MASITKHKDGWRAQVQRRGVRRSRVFDSKRAADDWARRVEYEILNGGKVAEGRTVAEIFDRYAREVSSSKKGGRWEVIRLEKMGRYPIARVKLGDLSQTDVVAWRDDRLGEVSPASVRREMQLMSAAFNVARKEWRWLSSNPVSDVRKPPASQRRRRLPTGGELEALAISAGHDPKNATARAFLAFLFGIETGMRAGEIVGLTWDRIDSGRRVAHLPETKNGEARDVPLSSEALRILGQLGDRVFDLSSRQLDVLWRKLRDRAGVEGLNFHDSRHAAVTRLSKKLEVLELARMIGHRDIAMLLTYYEADAEDMAKRLD